MEQKTITPKEQKAIDKVKRANAELAKIRRNQKKQLRKEQDHHKFIMGGCVAKYFLDGLSAFDFDEQEMNRIIACAFSLKDVKNMINTVLKEQPDPADSGCLPAAVKRGSYTSPSACGARLPWRRIWKITRIHIVPVGALRPL